MEEPSSLTEELFSSVFLNDLTWERIAVYLNPSDFKFLRQSSKLLLDKVNCVPQFFINKFQVQITSESYNEAFLQPPAIPTVEWKHAKIELSFFKPDARKIKSVLGHILPHLETVVVWDRVPSLATGIRAQELCQNGLGFYKCHYKDVTTWDDEDNEVLVPPKDNNVLYYILKNSTIMKELTMHYNVMWCDRVLYSIWDRPAVVKNLSHLEKLVVTAHTTKYPVLHGRELVIPEIPDSDEFEENIEALLRLTPRLNSFGFESVDSYFARVYRGRVYVALWPKRKLLRELLEFHDFDPDVEKVDEPEFGQSIAHKASQGGVKFPLLTHLFISGREYEDFVLRESTVHSLEMRNRDESISEAIVANVFTRPSLRALRLLLSHPCTLGMGTREYPLEFKNLEEFEMIKESRSIVLQMERRDMLRFTRLLSQFLFQ